MEFEFVLEKDLERPYEQLTEGATPSVKPDGHKTPPKDYPKDKNQYADPANYKYPIDTEEHVREAITYFSNLKNRTKYSPAEQKTMWARILKAAKKFGIKNSPEVKSRAQEVIEMKIEKVQEVVAELKAIAETLAKASTDPIEEQNKELESLGDGKIVQEILKVLKPAMAKLEEASKEIAEFLKQEPKHTDEAVATLEAKVLEGAKAIAELGEIKSKAAFETRVKELTDAGLYLETEAESVKLMSDDEFVSYKTKLTSLKASFADQQKKAEETAKITAEADKLKTEAALKVKEEADKKAKEVAVASLNTETVIESKDLRKLFAELI